MGQPGCFSVLLLIIQAFYLFLESYTFTLPSNSLHHLCWPRPNTFVKLHKRRFGCTSLLARGFGEYTDAYEFQSARTPHKKIPKHTIRNAWDTFQYSGKLRKGKVTPPRLVPNTILRPPYVSIGRHYFTHVLNTISKHDAVKSSSEIRGMREVGSIARQVLDEIGRHVEPGITTDQLDKIGHDKCIQLGAYPSPLHYKGYPKSICTSINEVLCHGIPDSTALCNGDIINIDVTCYYDGFHGDCSETYLVGDVDREAKRLVKSTFEIWQKAMHVCRGGAKLSAIGQSVEANAKMHNYTSLADFCGHGIGRDFHEEPQILHTANTFTGVMLPNMIFTVEPVICEGSAEHFFWPDDWTVVTKDGKRCAQFEDTILITEDGYESLTGKQADSPKYFWESETTAY